MAGSGGGEAHSGAPGVVEAAAAVRAGERSALQLTDWVVSRIGEHTGALNAFRWIAIDAARARAAEVDAQVARGEDPGPLAGVPVALKDNIAVAGMPLTAGSGVRRDHRALQDATVAAGLRGAGAVILGKLHLAEWAIGATTQNVHYGPARNPWDLERTTGGSSGGSGAAIAADLALATLGTDTGGSVRIPAALNGSVGLRPTHGRVSNHGVFPVSWSLDTVGPLARRAADVAAVLAVIAGLDGEDPTTADVPVAEYLAELTHGVRGLRVGVLGGFFRASPLVAAVGCALDAAAGVLDGAGVGVEAAQLEGAPEAVEVTADLMLAEAAAVHERRLAQAPEQFAPDVRTRLERGRALAASRYGYVRQRQRAWRRAVLDALADRDALLVPACPCPAPLLTESDPLITTAMLSRFTALWGLAGVPAIVVPVGFVDGLPVAMQLIGRPFAEGTLLRLAHAYQEHTDWHLRCPPLVAPSAEDALQERAAALLAATGASRVTVRLRDAAGAYPVVAEALAHGVRSLRDGGIDVRDAPTFRHLDRERRPLLQEDLTSADPPAPMALVQEYGARAQMLAPVGGEGPLAGFVSVHESAGPRRWGAGDIAALEEAAAAVARLY